MTTAGRRDRRRAAEAGIDLHLFKPADAGNLLVALERAGVVRNR